jgi:hypothetical protein
MLAAPRTWFRSKTPSRPATAPRRVRPEFERLEDRRVMSVTYHGGALLAHPEVQALYYGSDWSTNTSYYNQTGYLENYLRSVVSGSYMDMLATAGYGVGRGSFDQGRIGLANINKTQPLTDGQLRTALQQYIFSGALKSPDANRLYVIFVEDNVEVTTNFGNSVQNFLGYHGAFAGTDASGRAASIRYAVIPYPGGSVGNARISWLSTLDGLTEVTSHELAEAATNPDNGLGRLSWYEDSSGEEVGDLVNGQVVYLNGYAVQRIADRNDQAMTPAGAAPLTPASFVLQSNGSLWEHTAAGWTFVSSGVASVGDQAIDNHGRATVDFVTTGGSAYEYHDGGSLVYLAGGVRSARAGQGVSYLLFGDGSLYEYNDATHGWTYLDNNVAAIDAGTDRLGVNMVDVVFTWGDAYSDSDSSGWHFLGSNVRSASAGRQGYSELLLTNGNAYSYSEASNSSSFLGSKVAAVTAGTDPAGNLMIDLVFQGGSAYEWRAASGWTHFADGVLWLSKGRAGLVDVVFSSGAASEHDAAGVWRSLLTSGGRAAV